MKADHPDIHLKILRHSGCEAGAAQPAEAFVLDWIAARLSKPRRLRSQRRMIRIKGDDRKTEIAYLGKNRRRDSAPPWS
jgi:hypothetical protein